jgi:hypothetical protein
MNTALSHHRQSGHLDQLEAEGIYILREVAQLSAHAFYTDCKDSSVANLARKAFIPARSHSLWLY